MKYLSVCSGIEAASVAWGPLGWKPFAFSEIEKFPSKLLAHHYPETPNYGDMTKFSEWPLGTIDVLVGGTPCQSFSLAGLRKGLDDPRGNLMLTFGAIARRYRPSWLVWENVPGVLSSGGGRDFGSFLGLLGELGYWFSYRVFNARYFGVPQTRRRVFLVANLGARNCSGAVLFERESLSGIAPKGRGSRVRNSREDEASPFDGSESEIMAAYGRSKYSASASALRASGAKQTDVDLLLEAIPIDTMNHLGRKEGHSFGEFVPGAPCYTLSKGHSHAVLPPALLTMREGKAGGGKGPLLQIDKSATLATANSQTLFCGGSFDEVPQRARRLTPKECERLQGFPDDYTLIPGAKDGPRYKALGNSMAVPVMRWIGERIQFVEGIRAEG